MKCVSPEIAWHNRDPVLSVDFQQCPLGNRSYRLATGGADHHVLLWHISVGRQGGVELEHVADLTYHQKAVNVVRWAPSGLLLASGDDDANIIVWHQKADAAASSDGEGNKETWVVLKVLRGHQEDIYDISWCLDSTRFISGSVDNTAILWDVTKGQSYSILSEHKGFVQGVAWNQKHNVVATLSSDRSCRLFREGAKHSSVRISKGVLPVPPSHCLASQTVRYFHDDTLKSYFRRPHFSPDSNLLVAPAGCVESDQCSKLYSTYLFTIDKPSSPAAILLSPEHFTVAAKFSPLLYRLRPDGPSPAISLPYRMVFAVATKCSMVLYDTQQLSPIVLISNIHYTNLTDVAWSHDGLVLIASSTDGYCSMVTFEAGELGEQYVPPVETAVAVVDKEKENDEEIKESPKRRKVVNTLEKWTFKSDKKPEKVNPEKKSLADLTADEDDRYKPSNAPAQQIAVRKKLKEQNTIQNSIKVWLERPETKPCDTSKCVIDLTLEDTQDIKLVLEDVDDKAELVTEKAIIKVKEEPSTREAQTHATPKRRVELITLSSPKSKSKDEGKSLPDKKPSVEESQRLADSSVSVTNSDGSSKCTVSSSNGSAVESVPRKATVDGDITDNRSVTESPDVHLTPKRRVAFITLSSPKRSAKINPVSTDTSDK